tara:strand:+ start:2668 stop:2856 length:189 start_codon:yes stop_codon:yes gene_type:complete
MKNNLNINLKIEAKKLIGSEGIKFLKTQGIGFKSIYKSFNKELFLLPYKVQKLSKKSKRLTN